MGHVMEVIPKLRGLIEELESIKKAVVVKSGINEKSQDARILALDSLQISISSVGMWLQCSNSLANHFTNDGVCNEKGFLEAVGSGLDMKQTGDVMFNHLRLSFMTLAHFKIDNLFKNILRHLGSLPAKTGYWNLTDKILEECSIPKTGVEKNYLTAFANLRNSLHGNGIHSNNALSINIKGMAFDFIKGKRVECASWDHIIVLLGANVEIIGKILSAPKIERINVEIMDDFASGK